MAFTRPIVLIHGYSDKGQSFEAWRDALKKRGGEVATVDVCTYISLNNEITISDIGEGLDRALEYQLNWADGGSREFDAIVHSTGMLVLRSWLANYGARRGRLKHLIGLAPATFGSPLAHKGRSLLGSIFKGNHDILSPDFLNAGDKVLDALELGSRFTWDLTHKDLLADPPFYTNDANSPYVAVFVGDTPYAGVREVINEPGTDGTVRWAGAGLNTRKIRVNLARSSNGVAHPSAVELSKWADNRLDIPIIGVAGANHATILSDAGSTTSNGIVLADLIADFFETVDAPDKFNTWLTKARTFGEPAMKKMDASGDAGKKGWQQFVFRAVDEKNEPITDYSITLCRQPEGNPEHILEDFEADVHAYRADPSLRCFHVNLPLEVLTREEPPAADSSQNGQTSPAAPAPHQPLYIRLNASTGTRLLQYQAYDSTGKPISLDDRNGDILLDVSHLTNSKDRLFFPYTTTFVEICLNRETLPLDNVSELLYFLDEHGNPRTRAQSGGNLLARAARAIEQRIAERHDNKPDELEPIDRASD